jgi:hypothetical protein
MIEIEFAAGARIRITGAVDVAAVTAAVEALADRSDFGALTYEHALNDPPCGPYERSEQGHEECSRVIMSNEFERVLELSAP